LSFLKNAMRASAYGLKFDNAQAHQRQPTP
jgi:hypothetical protein